MHDDEHDDLIHDDPRCADRGGGRDAGGRSSASIATTAGPGDGGRKGEGGLALDATDNGKADVYVDREREAEHPIGMDVRAAAQAAGARLPGSLTA
ncbi:hypothetical protein ABZ829_32325 [Streptomyces xanthochromogenes]|uniref:hypothetical protein n=1 Tax=Streptomyces xanthochromogenes TaxID=67384 RepID=UPI0034138B3E